MVDRLSARASELPNTDLNPRDDPPLDFPDREFGSLTASDYAELGFQCGLEVHQQLHTARKLFCRCPAGRFVTRTDATVLRHMRPTLSELGEYDGCALMEFKTRKEIVYLLEHGTVCTYELDDTPPFPIDEVAVRHALRISRMFDLQLVSELQVMRKQYLDGSIPTGFQRTALIGIGGTIPFHDSELGDDQVLRIRQLTLEEDSCREVSDIGHRITFRTDRLGMPLVETVTEPDLRTPHDVAAGGRLIAAVARASGHARRGSGSGRQDVNVSIAGSRRVELKGVGRHAVLPRLVHNEAFRHLNLLRIRAALRERGITADLLDGCLHADLGGLLAGCGFAPIERAARDGSVLRAVRLPGFGTLLGHRTQPGRTFAHEFAERVRVIACLTTRPFLLAEDDDGGALAAARWREVRMAVRADAEDAVLLVWGPREDIDTASHEIVLRAKAALVGVPSETRQAHPDGTTGFERILPGPQRMYPDTDTPPLPIPDAWVAEVESRTVELPWQRRARYIAKGLPAPAARRMAHSTWAELYDELAIEDPPTARRIAFALEARLPHFWRSSGVRTLPAAERLRPLVRALVEGRMHPSGTNWVLDRLLREPDTAASDIVDAHRLDDRPADPLPASPTTDANARLRWAMGRTLRGRTRGSFDPQQIRTDLSHSLGEVRE